MPDPRAVAPPFSRPCPRISPRPHAEYYFNADIELRPEVAHAGGLLFIANGEPSALAFRAAGVQNSVSFFGETAIPSSPPPPTGGSWMVPLS